MPNVLSIFSGGGGIDCGFKKAGFDICFSTDFWKPACDTLEKNKVGKLVVCDDIRKIDYDKYLADIGMKKSDIDILNPDFIELTRKEHWKMKTLLLCTNILGH